MQRRGKRTEELNSSSCMSARDWPIKLLLLLLRCLSEKNNVVMKEHKKTISHQKAQLGSRPPAKDYHFDDKKQISLRLIQERNAEEKKKLLKQREETVGENND